jgi:phosphoenolpyruvate synthase/pyruvate phosphate dikinase
VPVPDGFTVTADAATFLDAAGDRLHLRAAVRNGHPIIKIYEAGLEGIYLPTTCVDELIEALQHLSNRAKEMAAQATATIDRG